jgi:hypothetical protein
MKLFSQPKRRRGVFENKVLLKIFASKKYVVTKDHRKLQNEAFHNFYASPNSQPKNVMDREYISHGGNTNLVQNLIVKPQGKSP